MNKKGIGGLAIVSAIMVFLVGMVVVNILKPEITNARDSDNLDCSNVSISDGAKLTCLGVDTVVPYFFIAIFSVIIGVLLDNFIGGRE